MVRAGLNIQLNPRKHAAIETDFRRRVVQEIPGIEGVSEVRLGYISLPCTDYSRVFCVTHCCIQCDHSSKHFIHLRETSGVFMSLLHENAGYLDARSCVWERAVGQLLKPAWGELSQRACPLEPQWPNHFHVRDRVFLQSFMSSFSLCTENTKLCQFRILSSC